MRSIPDLCIVFRRFELKFAQVASRLYQRLKKTQQKTFASLSTEEPKAMDALKHALESPLVHALPNSAGHKTLDTGTYSVQIGFFLLHMQPDNTRNPICYWSHSLADTEQRNDATKHECLAIFWPVLLLRSYLEGHCFIIQTDHNALEWLFNLTDAAGRLAPWCLRLLQFDFDVIHHAGMKFQIADALSRL